MSAHFDQIFDPGPPDFLSNLGIIKIFNFEGDQDDLQAVKLFLEKVAGLQKLYLKFSLSGRLSIGTTCLRARSATYGIK